MTGCEDWPCDGTMSNRSVANEGFKRSELMASGLYGQIPVALYALQIADGV